MIVAQTDRVLSSQSTPTTTKAIDDGNVKQEWMYATDKQQKYEREKSIGEKGKLIEKRDAIGCACEAKEQRRNNDNEKKGT